MKIATGSGIGKAEMVRSHPERDARARGEVMMICFDRYYKPLIRTKATSPISLPARQAG